jgi:type VI secretion system protein ImpI
VGLTLELVSSGAEHPPAATRKVIGAAGGTIGRAKHSDWVLPDSKVSSRHARITCEGSVFYIEDTSTNGIFLNSPDNRLDPGKLYALHAGDPFSFDEPFPVGPVVSTSPPVNDPFAPLSVPHPEDELDPLKLLDPGPPRRATPVPPAAKDLGAGSQMDAHFRPPAVVAPPPAPPPEAASAPPPAGNFIPVNYNPLAPETGIQLGPGPPTPPPFDLSFTPEPPPMAPVVDDAARHPDVLAPFQPPAPVGPVRPGPPPPEREPFSVPSVGPRGPAGTGDLAAVLAAAGLQNVPVTPELAQKFGEILRVVVSGVMDVLRSRHQVKDEFRMRMTYFRPVDNNPLKFSVNVEDALHNLLVKRNEAYLGPVEAFQDAFDDLRNHQLAMLAGMRVAFESTLAEFAPDRLQEQFDRRLGKNSVFAVAAKMRYWDLFREHREEIARDPDAAFRRLFGDAFTRAYEEQLKRLKDGQGRG